jgi:hypothetical protein
MGWERKQARKNISISPMKTLSCRAKMSNLRSASRKRKCSKLPGSPFSPLNPGSARKLSNFMEFELYFMIHGLFKRFVDFQWIFTVSSIPPKNAADLFSIN